MDLMLMVNEAFCQRDGTSHLRPCRVEENEVLLIGRGFGLLIWLDRDGISMWYVDLDSEQPEVFDLAGFLLNQRKFFVDESSPRDGRMEASHVQSLRSYAKTLCEVAHDILSGDKTWLQETSQRVLPLNPLHWEKLRDASAKSRC